MTRFRWALLLLLCPVISVAQENGDAVQKALDDFVAQYKIVGASVAVLQEDGTHFESATGWQDREAKVKATKDTIYRLGSISKPVTTMAALQMVQAGKLSLFADVRTYVPEWPDKGVFMTLRHLLTHTSGIRHYIKSKSDTYYKQFSVADSLSVFKDDPLLFKPGERVSYSTHAFSLVARMVEVASGETFADYIAKHVADPSGAHSLRLEDRTKANPNRAMVYGLSDGTAKRYPLIVNISWKSGGGGMESSAPDLARFGIATMTSKLLQPQLTDFMFSDQVIGKLDTHHGLGWALDRDGNPAHSGAQQGCRTDMLLDMKNHTVYVVMCNTDGGFPIGQLLLSIRTAWKSAPALARGA